MKKVHTYYVENGSFPTFTVYEGFKAKLKSGQSKMADKWIYIKPKGKLDRHVIMKNVEFGQMIYLVERKDGILFYQFEGETSTQASQ